MEQWKRARGVEVSDGGRVRRLDGRLLRPWLRDSWPKKTTRYLVLDTPEGRFTVHRLVLEAFVGLRPEGMECRHLDGVTTNNCLANLCWGTHLENIQDSARLGHGRWKQAKLDEPRVRAILQGLRLGYKGKDLAEKYGVRESVISEIRHGKKWKHVPRSK